MSSVERQSNEMQDMMQHALQSSTVEIGEQPRIAQADVEAVAEALVEAAQAGSAVVDAMAPDFTPCSDLEPARLELVSEPSRPAPESPLRRDAQPQANCWGWCQAKPLNKVRDTSMQDLKGQAQWELAKQIWGAHLKESRMYWSDMLRSLTPSGNTSRPSQTPIVDFIIKYTSPRVANTTMTVQQYSELLYREIDPDDYELLQQLDEGIERKTLNQDFVDILPRQVTEEVVGEACLVCLDTFMAADVVIKLPDCGHSFHKECVSRWLMERHRSCPLCNQQVTSLNDY